VSAPPGITELAAAAAKLAIPHIDYLSVLPIMVMLGGAVVILGWSSLLRRPMDSGWVTSLTVLTASATLILSLFQWGAVLAHGAHTHIDGAIVQDGFSAFVSVLVSCIVLVSAVIADSWLRREGVDGPEFQVLLLLSAAGAMTMGVANDLIVVFLGLELLSIPLYVLAALNARRAESGEAALKYFVLGGFSSAIFVYGIALVYGATGTTDLPQIADYLARNVLLHDGLLLAGLALLLVGFGFKVAAVPFHLWAPDVYQGSPTPATGFMAAVAKVGGFAALLRVFVSSFHLLQNDWRPPVWVLACITLVFGAVVALWQRDVKRMLAYSSINHAGFVLLGLQAASNRGVAASLYYLFVYSFMVIGTFGVVSVVGGRGDRRHSLEAYRGLGARQPWLAGALTILLLAQAGVPFTTGFVAKLEVISAAVHAGSTDLAVVAMVSAAVAAFFYLRVAVLMYAPSGAGSEHALDGLGIDPAGATGSSGPSMPAEAPVLVARGEAGSVGVPATVVSPAPGAVDETIPAGVAFGVGLCVAVTVVFGIWPETLTSFAQHATLLLRP
jgi:NADH-quinone oxidoreductase subunit N